MRHLCCFGTSEKLCSMHGRSSQHCLGLRGLGDQGLGLYKSDDQQGGFGNRRSIHATYTCCSELNLKNQTLNPPNPIQKRADSSLKAVPYESQRVFRVERFRV